MNLEKSLILTGASDGIGKAMAFEFASRGFRLGLIARRKEELESVAKTCQQLGAEAVWIETVDVSNETHFENALATLDQKLNGVHIFIANAGITGRSNFTPEAWNSVKKTLSINVFGAIHGLEFMKIKMLERKRGTLVGVSSIAGSRGMPTAGAYSSSKAALTTHLETLRIDLSSKGISVVTIAPGFIDTAMTKLNRGTMPFLITPEKAAKIFVDGVIQKKKWIVAPRPYRFIYPILQMLPRSIFDFLLSRLYQKIR